MHHLVKGCILRLALTLYILRKTQSSLSLNFALATRIKSGRRRSGNAAQQFVIPEGIRIDSFVLVVLAFLLLKHL